MTGYELLRVPRQPRCGFVAAWLDLHTGFGHVQNDLEASGSPEPGADTVEVRASTSFGDITIRRSA